MAWLCKRAISGLQYTPFEFDQPENVAARSWIPFVEGRSPFMPPTYLTSATQVKAAKGQLPDVFTERTHHLCNQRFKDLLEELEPGIHFFTPITLKRKNGEEIDDHYMWTVGQDIDCILTEGMDAFWEEESGRTRFLISRAVDAARLAYKDGNSEVLRISAPATRGKHLWYGGLLGLNIEPRIFVSDEFRLRWKAGRFSAIDFLCPVKEVDVPWDPVANMGPDFDKWRARETMIHECWPKQPKRH